MPFTPFHLGPALAFWLPLRKKIHAPTFLVANVIVDVEPFLALFLSLRYPLHGYLHTFISAFFLGLVLGYVMFILEGILYPLYKMLQIENDRTSSLRSFMASGVSGTMLHVLLDSPLYSDIRPFYPIMTNPLYNPAMSLAVYSFCIWTGLFGLVFYLCTLASTVYDKLRKKR